MGFTAYGRKQLVDCLFMGGTPPTTLYIALTVAVPMDSDDSAQLVEPLNAEYARVAYVVADGFDEISPGVLVNARAVQFPTPVTDWGTVRGWALCTASTGGLVLANGPLKQTKRLGIGVPVQMRSGALRITTR